MPQDNLSDRYVDLPALRDRRQRVTARGYVFDLYALDTKLNIPIGASKQQVIAAMNDHILAHGQLTGHFRQLNQGKSG